MEAEEATLVVETPGGRTVGQTRHPVLYAAWLLVLAQRRGAGRHAELTTYGEALDVALAAGDERAAGRLVWFTEQLAVRAVLSEVPRCPGCGGPVAWDAAAGLRCLGCGRDPRHVAAGTGA